MARVSRILQPPRYDIYWELHGHGRGEKRLTRFTFYAPEPVKKTWFLMVNNAWDGGFHFIYVDLECLRWWISFQTVEVLEEKCIFDLDLKQLCLGANYSILALGPFVAILGLLIFTITISTTFRVSQFQLWGQSPYTALSLDTCNILHTSSSCFCGMLFCLHMYLWELVRYLWMWLTSPTCHLTFGDSCPFQWRIIPSWGPPLMLQSLSMRHCMDETTGGSVTWNGADIVLI